MQEPPTQRLLDTRTLSKDELYLACLASPIFLCTPPAPGAALGGHRLAAPGGMDSVRMTHLASPSRACLAWTNDQGDELLPTHQPKRCSNLRVASTCQSRAPDQGVASICAADVLCVCMAAPQLGVQWLIRGNPRHLDISTHVTDQSACLGSDRIRPHQAQAPGVLWLDKVTRPMENGTDPQSVVFVVNRPNRRP
ncbi:hypothetical protein BKA56DRAFT_615989 [Ilyonectria sp. MPI-CAGE-AT-0026]|nr:hypothetical protein BKA56DRAFT_615989 [Ilyonectria sp. MPI-CAGE-AT-0026]